MVAINIKKGLDIPILGKPEGDIRLFSSSGQVHTPIKQIALNLSEFEDLRFTLLAKVGDKVRIGDPIAEDRLCPGRLFVSPASGTLTDIRRGLKRALHDIVIDIDPSETYKQFGPLDPLHTPLETILERWKEGGGFTHIRRRPFDLLADPRQAPRTIFIKAIESLPFYPPAELQVKGHEALFQAGVIALSRFAPVHLVHQAGSSAFSSVRNAALHPAKGPHPIGNLSLHIQEIDPVRSAQDTIWTVNAHDVLILGSLLNGTYFIERTIGIGGPACLPDQTGFFRVREGFPIEALISGRVPHAPIRLISGDVLTGHTVLPDDFLGFNDFALVILRESESREFLHFLKLGANKYSASRAYLSGFLSSSQPFDFTTNQHGEERPFIDSSLYDKVMPLDIPTMPLVKAVLAEDYDLAEKLGLLDVVPEDFALPTFIDPSKIEMTEIIKHGLREHAKEVLH